MRTLLLKPRVVDDPGFHASVRGKRRRRKVANLRQHRLIRPRRLPNEVQQRLMRRRDTRRRHHRGDRLDALALAGHQQTGAIIHQRARSVRMPEHARQTVHVSRKPRRALPPRPVHLRRLRQPNESAEYQSLTPGESAKCACDSVELGVWVRRTSCERADAIIACFSGQGPQRAELLREDLDTWNTISAEKYQLLIASNFLVRMSLFPPTTPYSAEIRNDRFTS